MDVRGNTLRGRAAEFLAAYHLETHGLRTTHVDIPGDDLWCAHPTGRVYRVQVKSSVGARSDRAKYLRYQYKLYDGRADPSRSYDGVFLFVASDLRLLIARRWDDTIPISIKIRASDFTPDAMTESIRRTFEL